MNASGAKPGLYDAIPECNRAIIDETEADDDELAFFDESNKGSPKNSLDYYKEAEETRLQLNNECVSQTVDVNEYAATRFGGCGYKQKFGVAEEKKNDTQSVTLRASPVNDENALMEQIQIQIGYSGDLTEELVTQKTGMEFRENVNVNLTETVVILQATLGSLLDENKNLESRVEELGIEADQLSESKVVELYNEKLELKDETIRELKQEAKMMEDAFSAQDQTEEELENQRKLTSELTSKCESLQKIVEEMKHRRTQIEEMRRENEKMKACLELGTRYYSTHLRELQMLTLQPQTDPKIVALTQLVQSTCKLYSEDDGRQPNAPREDLSALRSQISALTSQMTSLVVDTKTIKDNLASDLKEKQKKALQDQCEKLTLTLQAIQPNRFVDYSKNAVALALIVILLF